MDAERRGTTEERRRSAPEGEAGLRRAVRRFAVVAVVLLVLYPISYGALRFVGDLRPRMVFENGFDENGRWTTDRAFRLRWGDRVMRGEAGDPWPERFFVTLYLPLGALEAALRGDEWLSR